MCLIAWNWQPRSSTPLLLLGNRDEFYQRPTLALHWWDDSSVLAGKDLKAGGTWLGVSRSGRLAALTNYRSTEPARDDAKSRGALVSEFLAGDMDGADYLSALTKSAGDYNPFNLLVFDGNALMALESRNAVVLTMPAGVGGVSNADFGTPWPKLTRLRSRLSAHLDQGCADTAQLLELLRDTVPAPDLELPHTGLLLDAERALSAAFIATGHYGTRSSSVVCIHARSVEFVERSFDPDGEISTRQETFTL